jgi:hypothetical protein
MSDSSIKLPVQGGGFITLFTDLSGDVHTISLSGLGTVLQLSSQSIPEDTATTTEVFTASVAGAYTGTPTYTLGGTDDASFSIDTNTGVVTLDLALDYETDPELSIDITVADIVPLPAVNPRTFTITVTDVAEGSEPLPYFTIMFA